MKKGITIVLVVLCIMLSGGVLFMIYNGQDRQAPTLTVSGEAITYKQGDATEALLEGVTAIDNRDGDVTDSIVVESIYPSSDGNTANVVYVVVDKANNVAKVNRTVSYETGTNNNGAQEPTVEEAPADADDNEAREQESQETATPTPTATPTGEAQTEADDLASKYEQEAEDEIAALPASAPRFYLTQYYLELDAGDPFDMLSYVRDIVDDVDATNALYRRIQVAGSIDNTTPGEYEVSYYVIDSAGNQSNEAILHVLVR